MARASTVTMLSLDRFAAALGVDPLHINQIQHGSCGQPLMQYAWQSPGRIGREELAYAIQHAEDLISDALGFYPLARWTQDVQDIGPRQKTSLFLASRGRIVDVGRLARTRIGADAVAVTYSDEDGDLIEETATISVATSVTDPEQVAIYYPDKSGADEWEIRPITVSISGGTATITCKKWQLVTEPVQEVLDPAEVESLDEDSFLEEVDVYRKYTDPSAQAQFEGYRSHCSSCGDSGCPSCEAVTQAACVRVLNPVTGAMALSPATWVADDAQFVAASWQCSYDRPRTMRVWYRSGYRDPNTYSLVRMSPRFERAVAILAMALIGEENLCDCLTALRERWSEDLGLQRTTSDGESTAYRLNRRVDWPFGTTRGGIEAWNLIRGVPD